MTCNILDDDDVNGHYCILKNVQLPFLTCENKDFVCIIIIKRFIPFFFKHVCYLYTIYLKKKQWFSAYRLQSVVSCSCLKWLITVSRDSPNMSTSLMRTETAPLTMK